MGLGAIGRAGGLVIGWGCGVPASCMPFMLAVVVVAVARGMADAWDAVAGARGSKQKFGVSCGLGGGRVGAGGGGRRELLVAAVAAHVVMILRHMIRIRILVILKGSGVAPRRARVVGTRVSWCRVSRPEGLA